MTTTTIPAQTLTKFVAEVVDAVFFDIEGEPDYYADVRSFADLHDVCDANEYFINAADQFGIVVDPTCDAFIDACNMAANAVDTSLDSLKELTR